MTITIEMISSSSVVSNNISFESPLNNYLLDSINGNSIYFSSNYIY